jgi:hypothetical protein
MAYGEIFYSPKNVKAHERQKNYDAEQRCLLQVPFFSQNGVAGFGFWIYLAANMGEC